MKILYWIFIGSAITVFAFRNIRQATNGGARHAAHAFGMLFTKIQSGDISALSFKRLEYGIG